MPPIFEASQSNPPNPFALFPDLAVEAVIWIAAQLRNAGETFLWICYLALSFASWLIQTSTETLYRLYAMLIVTAEILILLVAAIIGCLPMLLILAFVYNALSRVWVYTGK